MANVALVNPTSPNALPTAAVQAKYDEFAPRYDVMQRLEERVARLTILRKRLLSLATGNVLEVAAGTGMNLPFYSSGCRITAVDVSAGMLEEAGRKASSLGLDIKTQIMDAHTLEFADGEFDTVVSTMSTCTFADAVVALNEMGRVCKPGGKILLLEHGRSSLGPLAWLQDKKAEHHVQDLGCRWNLDPMVAIGSSQLDIVRAKRYRFGVFHMIEARPS